ncbi:hypothetical protein AB0O07_05750 [Streptomyces sp. NPDC093085]|uniref:hypothetical protein n=1 Tax=Streptomyces sp. NPDC093085 TaxID=3155068 RepID=UPI00343B8510
MKFAGSAWEEIGTNPDPAVVAAYGAPDGNPLDREPEHADRRVEAIELVVSEPRLPVSAAWEAEAAHRGAEHGSVLKRLSNIVGAAVVAAIAVAKVTDIVKDRESRVRKARQERKAMIDEQAQRARAAFEEVTRGQGQLLIDAVESHHTHHRLRLKSTLNQIMERINAEDTARSREIIARVSPVDQEGRALITALQDLCDALGTAPYEGGRLSSFS